MLNYLPHWLNPWLGLAGAAALGVLFFLYLWWRHSRRRTVPAVFLWEEPERERRDGRKRELRRLPLSFFLEALAILLIALAVMGPWWPRRLESPPLSLVLDNSASMLAGEGADSSLGRARAEAVRRIAAEPGRRVRLVLAGRDSRLLSDSASQPELLEALASWSGSDSEGRVLTAALSEEVRYPGHEIVVLTDRPRPEEAPAIFGWWSGGRPLDNVGIIAARRGSGESVNRIVLLLGKYLSRDAEIEVTLRYGNRAQRLPLRSAVTQAQLELPPGDAPVTIEVEWPGDRFPLDNRITLLSEKRPPLKIATSAPPETAAAALRAVTAGNPEFVGTPTSEAELFICSPALPARPAHRLIVHGGKGSRAQLAPPPYTVDYTHPLTVGLSLDGVLWNAAAETSLPGRVLISASDRTPLLSVGRRPGGWYDIHLNWRGDGGNLARHPAWPVLFMNLREWLSSERPGPSKANYALGDRLVVNGLRDGAAARLTLPGGETVRLVNFGVNAYYANLGSGSYILHIGDRSWPVEVNFLSPGESDLTGLGPKDYAPAAELLRGIGMRRAGWAALLAALAVLALHQHLLAIRRERE